MISRIFSLIPAIESNLYFIFFKKKIEWLCLDYTDLHLIISL